MKNKLFFFVPMKDETIFLVLIANLQATPRASIINVSNSVGSLVLSNPALWVSG